MMGDLARKELERLLDRIDKLEAAQQSVHPTNAPVLNYAYVKGVGHYKDCPVCIGECICG